MRTYKLFPFCLLCLILFSNCGDRKDPCEETKHYYFFVKPEEKAVLPYKGFDTLKLKHNSGAEYTYYAGAIDSLFTITAKATSPDCANNIIEHKQYYNLEFKSTTTSSPAISISVGLTSALNFSLLSINLKNNLFVGDASFPPYPNSNYFDNVNVQGEIYNRVMKLYQNRDVGSDNNVLYNVEFGILKISHSNGETWERIP